MSKDDEQRNLVAALQLDPNNIAKVWNLEPSRFPIDKEIIGRDKKTYFLVNLKDFECLLTIRVFPILRCLIRGG